MKSSRAWLWSLLLIPVIAGLVRLRLDVEVLNLLPGSLPVVQGLKLYQERFAHGHELIITVQSDSAQKSEETARKLAALFRAQTKLAREVIWQPPFSENPGQAAEMLAYLWYNSADFLQLTNRLLGAGLTNTLQQAREELATTFSPRQLAWGAYDPFGLTATPGGSPDSGFNPAEAEGLFASPDGTFRVLFVEPATDLSNYRACARWLESVHGLVEEAFRDGQLPAGVKLAYTGRPAFVREIAGGMERDMIGSVTGTMLIIAVLFYSWHRRWRPLGWLLAILGAVLVATLGLGGLVFSHLNVVSMGFAAILLGLAADYALVLYQEANEDTSASASQIRQRVGPGIIWSAVTTALAFAMLKLSRLPGLSQLGVLVAIGVGVAAFLILKAFLPPLLPIPISRRPRQLSPRFPNSMAWIGTGLLVLAAAVLLWKDRPRFDQTADSLRPRQSAAYAAVEEIKQRLERPDEPLWAIVSGPTIDAVAQRLAKVEAWLAQAKTNEWIWGYTVPAQLWPRPAQQKANRSTAHELLQHTNQIRDAAESAGFGPGALQLTFSMMQAWGRAAEEPVFWPTNRASLWILETVASRISSPFVALALVHPMSDPSGRAQGIRNLTEHWPVEWSNQGVILAGWELLGREIFQMVSEDLPRVLLPMTAFLLIALGLAFRDAREVLLSLATLAVSGLALSIVMDVAHWSWNLMNMMALPLLLGAGVDYSIHIQLAMRRHNGDAHQARSTTGWALLLCAATTFAAFGSLGFSSNAGLASLGRVCAAGVACAWIVAVALLPAWWKASRRLTFKTRPR